MRWFLRLVSSVEGGGGHGGRKNIIHSLSLAPALSMLSYRRSRRRGGFAGRTARAAKMNGFQRGLDSHPLYALDARSPPRATPSLATNSTFQAGGLHYRSDTTQSCWVGSTAVKSNREERAGWAAREAFFAGGLRSRPFKRPSSSLYASLSCLSASPVPLSLAISARSFVRPQPWPSPSSTPLFLPPAPPARELASICIWHRTQWTPRWPRWSTDRRRHRLWTGRRRMTAETAEEVNGGGGERDGEGASERKKEEGSSAAGDTR